MKLGTRWLGVATAVGVLLGVTAVSQGCTLTTNDSGLDGGGFDGNSSPPFNACDECVFQDCTGQWAVCNGNKECQAIYLCAVKAVGIDAVTACYNAHPAGQSAYYALASCNEALACTTCSNKCAPSAGECPAPPPPVDSGADTGAPDSGTPDSGTVDSGTPEPKPQDCSSCTVTKCGTEKTACGPNTVCEGYAECLNECEDVACIDKCGVDFAAGKEAQAKLSTCMLSNCKDICGL
jgi:hypothetical protein